MAHKIIIGSETFKPKIKDIKRATKRLAEVNPKITIEDARFYLCDSVVDEDEIFLQAVEALEETGVKITNEKYIKMYLKKYAEEDIVFSANGNLGPHELNPENSWIITSYPVRTIKIMRDPAADPSYDSVAEYDKTFPDGINVCGSAYLYR